MIGNDCGSDAITLTCVTVCAFQVLQLLALGINCRRFDFLDKPSDQDIENALKQLYQLGAITTQNGDELTTLGWNMSKFPLDPRFSKILLSSSDFGCLDEVCIPTTTSSTDQHITQT